MAYDITVTSSNGLNYRTGPGTSYAKKGAYPKGTKLICSEKTVTDSETWYKIQNNGFWVCGRQGSDWYIKDNKPPAKPTPKPDASKPNISDTTSTGTANGLDAKLAEMLKNQVTKGGQKFDGSTRLFGAPFQFTKETDYRPDSIMDLGRMYTQNIISEAPIVNIIPGKPDYLPDSSKDQKAALSNLFAGKGFDDKANNILSQILGSDDIRYFGFVSDYSAYMKYVNLLCRITAIYLGIGEKQAPNSTVKYKDYNWSNYRFKNEQPKPQTDTGIFDTVAAAVSDTVNDLVNPYSYVSFYADGSNSNISEGNSNSTTDSSIASTFTQSMEGFSKDIHFLGGALGLENLDKELTNFGVSVASMADSIPGKPGGLMDRLAGATTDILKGSNIIFPEIWTDSSYDRPFDVSINLHSPYGDKESIYLTNFVPMMHIIAFALGRQTSANGYTSPFLVKATSPGWWNCEMGIIDNLRIEKSEWTVDGLPSSIKISFSIKDLYSALMITPTNQPANFFSNGGLIDFLALTSGIDITKPQLAIKIQTITNTLINRITDIPENLHDKAMEWIREKIAPFTTLRF